jgi:hypothetical protein
MAATGRYICDIVIEQGCDLYLSLTNEDTYSMAGFSYVAMVKDKHSGLLITALTCSFTSATRTLIISLTDTQTTALAINENCEWDCIQTDGSGLKSVIISGDCQIIKVISV